jgi:hypothetical protein
MIDIDERHFEAASLEFETNRNNALWLKCLTLANGDEASARFKYIEETARRLQGTPATQEWTAPVHDGAGFLRRLFRGDFGMARTFWFGLVGYWTVMLLLRTALTLWAQSSSLQARYAWLELVPYELGLQIIVYSFLTTAVWRASLRYEGDFFWVVSTRVALLLIIIWLVVGSVAGYGNYLAAAGQI